MFDGYKHHLCGVKNTIPMVNHHRVVGVSVVSNEAPCSFQLLQWRQSQLHRGSHFGAQHLRQISDGAAGNSLGKTWENQFGFIWEVDLVRKIWEITKKQQLDFLDEHSRSEVRIQAVRLGKYPGYPICGHQNMGKVWQSMINHEVLRHLILD